MRLYVAGPSYSTAGVITPIATGTALKTLLQVVSPATTDIRIWGWGVSFAGVAPIDPPGLCQLSDSAVATAATVTSLTPTPWGNPDAPVSGCIGGTSATGVNASAEGSITTARVLDPQYVHPQTGYAVWFPSDVRPLVKASRSLRVRTIFSVSVNALPWIVWSE